MPIKIKVKPASKDSPPISGPLLNRTFPASGGVFNPFGSSLINMGNYQRPTTFRLSDTRKVNPTTGIPLKSTDRRTMDVDSDTVKSIITHAKAKGVDPYTALAIAYQESGINKERPFHLNPTYFKTPFANAEGGVNSIVTQMQYAKGLQQKGVVPNDEASLLQGYNGYGFIKQGHADLEGSKSIYGYPIPEQGIDFKKTPLYGKTIISLRDEIIKNNPDIKKLVESK